MADEDQSPASSDTDATFEAQIRQQRELMVAMASREKWDGESRWLVQARKLAGGALYLAAFASILVILWVVASVFLNS